jgi:hypothetical protein
LTIVGIPFAVRAFKLASFSLWPFGRDVVPAADSGRIVEVLVNPLWLVLLAGSACAPGHHYFSA